MNAWQQFQHSTFSISTWYGIWCKNSLSSYATTCCLRKKLSTCMRSTFPMARSRTNADTRSIRLHARIRCCWCGLEWPQIAMLYFWLSIKHTNWTHRLAACLLKSLDSNTVAIELIIAENAKPPTSIPTIAKVRSDMVIALMSPYPTVVMVVKAQYLKAIKQVQQG